uniref:Ig-like domain-containing protein n=1 Tax=Castor canadensis TaxID=51338 RepID=A0A8C0XQC6_CASCN
FLLPSVAGSQGGGGRLMRHPRLHIQVQEAVMIQEGLCALVPCVILYSRSVWNHSAPAYGYWYWKKKNVNKQEELVATNDPDREADVTKSPFQLVGDPRANDCSLGISEPRKENSGRYFFRLERESEKLASKSSLLNLTITGLTQLPDIHILEPLESGRLSLLKCSMPGACKGDLSPTFSWTGASLRSLGLDLEAYTTSEIKVTPLPQDHGTYLTCRVTLPKIGVSTERTVQLNVSCECQSWSSVSITDPPEELTVTVSQANRTELEILRNGSSLPVLQGQSLRLVCVTHSNPPARLSWVQGTKTLSLSRSSDPGVLELPVVQEEHEGDLTCQAQNLLGTQHFSLSLSVHCEWMRGHLGPGTRGHLLILSFLPTDPPQLLGPFCSWGAEGLTCRKSAEKNGPRTPCSFQVYSPPEAPPPARAPPPAVEELELHYASLSFRGLRPREAQDPEDATPPSTRSSRSASDGSPGRRQGPVLCQPFSEATRC